LTSYSRIIVMIVLESVWMVIWFAYFESLIFLRFGLT
jgi:hypothetical protein